VRVQAILNRDGGSLKTLDVGAFGERLRAAFAAEGREAKIAVVAGADLLKALDDAAADDRIEAIVAGGGDGTVSAAAAAAWRGGKTLGVLPAGTMNLFARSLGLPLDLEAAAAVLARARPARSDIGLADGRPFVHQFSVGLHAYVLSARESFEYASRIGKMLASARASLRAFSRPRVYRAEMTYDGARESGRYAWIAVSNNPYGVGHMPYADRVDGGRLGLYRVGRIGQGAATRLAADMLRGAWQDNPHLQAGEARRVDLVFPRRRRSDKAALDGELIPLPEKVTIETRPGALRRLNPLAEDEVRP